MSNRLAAGFTVAGFPLTASLLAITSGNYCLALPLGLLFGIAIILTLAPKLPGLHDAPLVGAPRLTAGFKANGSVEFHGPPERPRVVLAATADSFPFSVLVQIGVTNHRNQDVRHALVNFGAPARRGLQVCDGWGRIQEIGRQMLPTHEGYDYWSIDDYRFSGGDGRLFYFRFRILEPGIYPIFVAISSRDLYRELVNWAEIDVVEKPEAEVSTRDRLAPLIDKGELLLRQIPNLHTKEAARLHYLAWFLDVLQALSEPRLEEDFKDANTDWPRDRIGDDFYRAEAKAKLKHLYELRDLLGGTP